MIVLIMFIMRIPLKDMLVMIIPIVFVLLTLSPWFPPIFCSHRGATVEVLLFKTEEKVAPTYTVNGLIGIPSLSITITFKPMKNHLSPYFTVYFTCGKSPEAPLFWPLSCGFPIGTTPSSLSSSPLSPASSTPRSGWRVRRASSRWWTAQGRWSGSWVKPLVAYRLIGMIVGQL